MIYLCTYDTTHDFYNYDTTHDFYNNEDSMFYSITSCEHFMEFYLIDNVTNFGIEIEPFNYELPNVLKYVHYTRDRRILNLQNILEQLIFEKL